MLEDGAEQRVVASARQPRKLGDRSYAHTPIVPIRIQSDGQAMALTMRGPVLASQQILRVVGLRALRM